MNSPDTEWDYSIASACIISLLVAYVAHIVSLYYRPLDTRNKLTITIWWSLFISMLVIEIKNSIFVAIEDTSSRGLSVLCSYAIGSIWCFFYVNAILLQSFEWQLLASMILYQSKYQISELMVAREDYRKSE